MRIYEHTDFGSITLLFADTPGLQVSSLVCFYIYDVILAPLNSGGLTTQICPHNPRSYDLESSHSDIKSSPFVLRTVPHVLRLKISVFS